MVVKLYHNQSIMGFAFFLSCKPKKRMSKSSPNPTYQSVCNQLLSLRGFFFFSKTFINHLLYNKNWV